MAKTETRVEETNATAHTDGWSTAGWSTAVVVFGALGALAAVWAYWMLVPGIAAIVLGFRARRRSSREAGSVAIALGIVALLLVPSVLVIVDAAEDWVGAAP